METWGNKVKKALSRLGKTDNYLYNKPEQDWTQKDKALVIAFLRKSKVAENTQMEDLKSMIEDVIADMIKSGELEGGNTEEESEEVEDEEVEDEEDVDLAELLREIEEMEGGYGLEEDEEISDPQINTYRNRVKTKI